jgi:hypothetical protein
MSEKQPADTELKKHTILGHIKAAGWAVVFGFTAYGLIMALRWGVKALGFAE